MHMHGDLVHVHMGILRACVGTRCVHAWGSYVCAFVHGDLVRARMGVLCACVGTQCVHAWESCVHAFVHGDPVHAHMVILRVCMRGDPVHAHMGIVRAWTWSMHARDPACTVGTRCMHACVRGSGMGVRIQRAQAEDQYHI